MFCVASAVCHVCYPGIAAGIAAETEQELINRSIFKAGHPHAGGYRSGCMACDRNELVQILGTNLSSTKGRSQQGTQSSRIASYRTGSAHNAARPSALRQRLQASMSIDAAQSSAISTTIPTRTGANYGGRTRQERQQRQQRAALQNSASYCQRRGRCERQILLLYYYYLRHLQIVIYYLYPMLRAKY